MIWFLTFWSMHTFSAFSANSTLFSIFKSSFDDASTTTPQYKIITQMEAKNLFFIFVFFFFLLSFHYQFDNKSIVISRVFFRRGVLYLCIAPPKTAEFKDHFPAPESSRRGKLNGGRTQSRPACFGWESVWHRTRHPSHQFTQRVCLEKNCTRTPSNKMLISVAPSMNALKELIIFCLLNDQKICAWELTEYR